MYIDFQQVVLATGFLGYVLQLANKYRQKGFQVVGISFDDSKEDWQKAVQELGIEWPQMSDLKGWQSEAATTWHITSIPATILYDPEGKVLKTNLRGEGLGQALQEIFGE